MHPTRFTMLMKKSGVPLDPKALNVVAKKGSKKVQYE